MIEDSVQTRFGELAYRRYCGPAAERTLVCIHGYDRSGRDFARLAAYLGGAYDVVCPDLFGRGRSTWLVDKHQYHPETYAAAITELLARLNVHRFDCFGTSVGGHVALLLSQTERGLERLIVNDISPFTDVATFRALAKGFRARRRAFESFDDAVDYTAQLNRAFGLTTREEWAECALSTLRVAPDGRYLADYDPDLPVVQESPDVRDRDLWPIWKSLRRPTLLVRGARSRVLTRADAARMIALAPGAQLVEVADCGHAPMFYAKAQLTLVRRFLEGESQLSIVETGAPA